MDKKKKKFFWITLGVILFWCMLIFAIFAGFAKAEGLPGFKTYRSQKLGIEFTYPKILKVEEKNGVITVSHKIGFKHRSPCDGSGLPENEYSKEIYDFYIQMSILDKSLDEIVEENLLVKQNGVAVDFVDYEVVKYGQLEGPRIYNGNHGCGPYVYFFKLTDRGASSAKEKFLRVEQYPAPEFNESAVSKEDIQIYARLRQILLPEQEEHYFQEIIYSLKMNFK